MLADLWKDTEEGCTGAAVEVDACSPPDYMLFSFLVGY